jgi:hypothetical protein
LSNFFPVFLLDMDNVLVEPRGYRLAVQATLGYFTQKMGLGDLYPGEEVITRFEAINMTSEWDITPILLASIFDGLLEANPGLTISETLEEACKGIHSLELKPPRQNLSRLISILAAHFNPEVEFADLALDLNRPGTSDLPFPSLLGHVLLENILSKTRILGGASTTNIFQHFVLGSKRWEEIYGLPRLFDCASILEKNDRQLLSADTRNLLLQVWRDKKVGVVVYTARPSLPEEHGPMALMYSPEADLAMETLRISELPLIGAGQMDSLAVKLGCRSNQLIKPSPVQALAAITAAVSRQTDISLQAAGRLYLTGEKSLYQDFPQLSIHVFEDSGGNVSSVRQAGDILTTAGLPNRVNAWGISQNKAKRQALDKVGARLMPDINLAVRAALAGENI